MKSSLAPHRCFCGEVTKEQQQRGKLRVMGTLVSIVPLAVPFVEQEDDDGPYTQRFILDDGTNEVAQFLASDHMANAVQIGMTIDCVVHVLHKHNKQQRDEHETTTSTLLVIHTLIIMPDGGQALSLRNMEILHQRQRRSSGRATSMWDGTDHTTNTAPSMTWHEINNIIQAEAEIGVRLEDLQEMFVVEKDQLQEIIQELQMQGLVYQSKNGAYLPL